jgi:hypothetical protein
LVLAAVVVGLINMDQMEEIQTHLLLLQTVAVVEQVLLMVGLEDLVVVLQVQHLEMLQAEVQLKETHLQEQVTEMQVVILFRPMKNQAVAEVLIKQELL